MSDRKSGNSSVSNSTIAVGVAAAAAVGGLLYYLFNKDNEQGSCYEHHDTRHTPSDQPQTQMRSTRAVPSDRPIPSANSNPTSATVESRDNIETCCICCEALFNQDESSMPVEIPCNHYFHMACIRTWLKHVRVCPLCGSQIPDDLKAIYF